MSAVAKFTQDNFQSEVLESNLPVLVDFTATWCGPCKALMPIVEELATEYAGKVKIGKVDIDENPDLTSQFDVMGVPTLVFMKKGQAVASLTGGRSKAVLKGHLDSLL